MGIYSFILENLNTLRKTRSSQTIEEKVKAFDIEILLNLKADLSVSAKDRLNPTDDEVISTIKTAVKKYAETIDLLKSLNLDITPAWIDYQYRINLLSRYLPMQLDENDLLGLWRNLDEPTRNLKNWMTFLKTNYAGQYNGSLAKKVFENQQ